eukprot:1692850-Pleurochrysis_carterae.AAC.2
MRRKQKEKRCSVELRARSSGDGLAKCEEAQRRWQRKEWMGPERDAVRSERACAPTLYCIVSSGLLPLA